MSAVDFVAIDFETANRRRGSVCEIGYASVVDGIIIDSGSWLVKPPAALSGFEGMNIGVHGIHEADVADAPTFLEGFSRLLDIVGDRPIVTHNAAFEIGCIRDAHLAENIDWPNLDYACTLVLSRRELPLISYRLPIVADALGVELPTHHRAADDSVAAAGIAVKLAERRGANSLDDLLAQLQVRMGHLVAGQLIGGSCRSLSDGGGGGTHPIPPETNANADPEHPLYGQVMTFTGALSLTRADAWAAVAFLGATPSESVTQKTTVLVVGDGFAGDDPTDFETGKAKKAVALLAKGQRIEVMTEGQLLELLA